MLVHKAKINLFILRFTKNYYMFSSDANMARKTAELEWFVLQPCVESLFLTLMNEFWKVLTPVILSLMQEYQTPINFDDVNAILMKDASKFINIIHERWSCDF